MNDYIKAAVIIAFAIAFAMGVNIYLSPFQTCKRELAARGNESILYCAIHSR